MYMPSDTATFSVIYSLIPFLNIVFTYGLETAFFRFAKDYPAKKVYAVFLTSVIVSSSILSIILYAIAPQLTYALEGTDHPEFFRWMVFILFFDTIAAIVFSKIRFEEKPKRFALAKMLNIVLHLGLFTFFLVFLPWLALHYPKSSLLIIYDSSIGIGYYIIANIIASIASLLFLYKDLFSFQWLWDAVLMRKVLKYSLPLLLVGLGGMINELLSRVCYQRIAIGSPEDLKHELGVFSACYKLVVLITIFIQMYKLAVEPFFFKKSSETDAKPTYARLMKMYVIASCFMYLFIVLFLDVWKKLITIKYPEYAEGISIVPILSLGAVFLGIYYNQSIWYKLTDKNKIGAYITLGGAIITIVLNIILIPLYKYNGAAYANLACYVFMMLTSYFLGQKYYAINYPLKKIGLYIGLALLLYCIHAYLALHIDSLAIKISIGFAMMLSYLLVVLKVDRKEFVSLPLVGKYLK